MELAKLRRELFNGIAEASGLMPRSFSLAKGKMSELAEICRFFANCFSS